MLCPIVLNQKDSDINTMPNGSPLRGADRAIKVILYLNDAFRTNHYTTYKGVMKFDIKSPLKGKKSTMLLGKEGCANLVPLLGGPALGCAFRAYFSSWV